MVKNKANKEPLAERMKAFSEAFESYRESAGGLAPEPPEDKSTSIDQYPPIVTPSREPELSTGILKSELPATVLEQTDESESTSVELQETVEEPETLQERYHTIFKYKSGPLSYLKHRHWTESWVKLGDKPSGIKYHAAIATLQKEPEPLVEIPELEPLGEVPEPEPPVEMPELKLPPTILEQADESEDGEKVICPVCGDAFSSLLNFERHAVSIDVPSGKHIQWLEGVLDKPFSEFGGKSEKEMAIALTRYWRNNQRWPE